MRDNRNMIKKLQTAINQRFGEQLLYERRQFYSTSENRPINMYVIKKALYNPVKNRQDSIEMFKTSSQIQTILYLRDYWFELNGWEIPIDNPDWNMIKVKEGLTESVLRKERMPAWAKQEESE